LDLRKGQEDIRWELDQNEMHTRTSPDSQRSITTPKRKENVIGLGYTPEGPLPNGLQTSKTGRWRNFLVELELKDLQTPLEI